MIHWGPSELTSTSHAHKRFILVKHLILDSQSLCRDLKAGRASWIQSRIASQPVDQNVNFMFSSLFDDALSTDITAVGAVRQCSDLSVCPRDPTRDRTAGSQHRAIARPVVRSVSEWGKCPARSGPVRPRFSREAADIGWSRPQTEEPGGGHTSATCPRSQTDRSFWVPVEPTSVIRTETVLEVVGILNSSEIPCFVWPARKDVCSTRASWPVVTWKVTVLGSEALAALTVRSAGFQM
jgi:hypothetical protein